MAIFDGFPKEEIQEPRVEPPVEYVPEESVFEAWWRTYTKFTTDRIYTREEFFDEVGSQFRAVPYRERKSRAGPAVPGIPKVPRPGLPITPASALAPDTGDLFMERLQQGLMAKFRPESRESTMYRTMREAERKEGAKKDYKVRPMSKEAFLKDLEAQVSSVQWKEKKSVHKATIARPGLRQNLQRELKDGNY